MVTPKKTGQAADDIVTVEGVAIPETAPAAAHPIYRDKVFTSRTLIYGDDRTAQVVAGRIAADNDELVAFLNAHAEFEPPAAAE